MQPASYYKLKYGIDLWSANFGPGLVRTRLVSDYPDMDAMEKELAAWPGETPVQMGGHVPELDPDLSKCWQKFLLDATALYTSRHPGFGVHPTLLLAKDHALAATLTYAPKFLLGEVGINRTWLERWWQSIPRYGITRGKAVTWTKLQESIFAPVPSSSVITALYEGKALAVGGVVRVRRPPEGFGFCSGSAASKPLLDTHVYITELNDPNRPMSYLYLCGKGYRLSSSDSMAAVAGWQDLAVELDPYEVVLTDHEIHFHASEVVEYIPALKAAPWRDPLAPDGTELHYRVSTDLACCWAWTWHLLTFADMVHWHGIWCLCWCCIHSCSAFCGLSTMTSQQEVTVMPAV